MDESKHSQVLRPASQLSKEELRIIEQDVLNAADSLKRVRNSANEIIWGQEDVVDLSLTCILAGGNGFIEGVPGLAKTLFLENLAPLLSLEFNRIQFTPDLMPADILGSEILQDERTGRKFVMKGRPFHTNEDGDIEFDTSKDFVIEEILEGDGKKKFEFVKGPIFTQLLMGDEINRAGPRTQSALLQAMQEKAVTTAGQTLLLPNPYIVMATQNPLEQDGTYPLPEAQLDRFLAKINIDYPNREAFKRVITETTSANAQDYLKMRQARESGENLTIRKHSANKVNVEKVLESANELILMQKLAQTLPLTETFVNAVVDMVEYTRPDNSKSSDLVKDHVAWGAGPRAGQAFAQAARARALMDGRYAPNLSDVRALAKPILGHRMAVSFAATAQNINTDTVIEEVMDRVLG